MSRYFICRIFFNFLGVQFDAAKFKSISSSENPDHRLGPLQLCFEQLTSYTPKMLFLWAGVMPSSYINLTLATKLKT